MASKLKETEAKSKTRLLLMLWNLGGLEAEVKKGELNKQVKLNKESAKAYDPVYEKLEEEAAIAITQKGRSFKISLTQKGLQTLKAGLVSTDFQYSSRQRVRTKDFNALLKWIQSFNETSGEINEDSQEVNGNTKSQEKVINSYTDFQPLALEVYDQLNQDYNLDHLVPIYRMRRTIGDRVTRSQFNEWLLEMQADDIFQLIGGEMPGLTLDKEEDSVQSRFGGIRYYAKRLNS